MLQRLHSSDEDLLKRVVLLVDDDTRKYFRAEQRARAARHGSPDGHHRQRSAGGAELGGRMWPIVLMDIMNAGMDGYETIQEIRNKAAYRRLPILALTPRPWKGDAEKCLECGASRLSGEAGEHRATAVGAAHVAAIARSPAGMNNPDRVNILAGRRPGCEALEP